MAKRYERKYEVCGFKVGGRCVATERTTTLADARKAMSKIAKQGDVKMVMIHNIDTNMCVASSDD